MAIGSRGLEEHLVTLLQRRSRVFEDRLCAHRRGEALADGVNDAAFRSYMDEMRLLGAEILDLDVRIEEVRAEIVRDGRAGRVL